MDADLKKHLEDQPQLFALLKEVEGGRMKRVVVCQSVGFHDDPAIHARVVQYIESKGVPVYLAPDGKPDLGLAGRRN